jgi:uncharacterized membrane protein
MIIFFAIIMFFFFIIQINLVALAFIKVGIPGHYVFAALLATLLGSFINIPVKKIPQEAVVSEKNVRFFGFTYTVPVWEKKMTLLTVNLGGAIIPVAISIYLLFKTDLYFKVIMGTLLMTLVAYRLARPIKGVGIALPFFLPPLLAALFSVMIAYHHAPVIAYISGTLGTLIGADLLNLNKIRNLGAPVASISGAGTFDGIFLTGILAVVLSALIT